MNIATVLWSVSFMTNLVGTLGKPGFQASPGSQTRESRVNFRTAPAYVEFAQVIDKPAVSKLGVVQRFAVLESA